MSTSLGRMRILASTAGVRVSPLVLGGGNIGESWSKLFGYMDKKSAFALLDAFVEAGGNFIDTANSYQSEESETWIGEWIAERGNRDQLVIATKFTADYKAHGLRSSLKTVNHSGNHRRSLKVSVRDSLAKLQTDYIDLLYVHWWDDTTSIEELMDSLHFLVQQGTVLYLGISDAPAWIVSAANVYARHHGKTQFSVYQGRWNVLLRDFERDIIPMARMFGMALVPWGVLGRGKFQTPKMIEDREKRGEKVRGFGGAQTEAEINMSEALAKVAAEHSTESVTAIALAYVLRKAADCGIPNVFPIVGGRRSEQLHENIQALDIQLSDDQMEYLESIAPFDLGFPGNFIVEEGAIRAAAALIDRPSYQRILPGPRKQ